MTGKHSPGPWVWEAGIGLLVDADGRVVIDLGMSCDKDDARLITAAPDLLAAARLALDWLVSTGADGSPLPALQSAIAKAEGRADA